MGEKEAIEKLKSKGMSPKEAEDFIVGVKKGLDARKAGNVRSWAEISASLFKECPGCDKNK